MPHPSRRRRISFALSTALLTIAPPLSLGLSLALLPTPWASASTTQAARTTTTCPTPSLTIGDLEQRISRMGSEINQKGPREALRQLQELLPQVSSSSNAALRASLLEQLLNEPLGLQPMPLRELQQALELDLSGPDRGASQAQLFISFIKDLSQTAQGLPAGHSLTKVRALVQLADYAISLGQPQLAPPLLQAAETAAQTGVQGDAFRVLAWAEVARGQAIANLPNARINLGQAGRLYDQLPVKSRSQKLALHIGLAAASLGDEPLTQSWLKAVNDSGLANYINQTLVQGAIRNRNHTQALGIARRITDPALQAQSLGEVSEFYARNASPVTGRAVLTQAWSQTKAVATQQQFVNAATQAGYLDLAIDWNQQIRSDSPGATFPTLILALAKAQQPEKAGPLLERYLQQIQTSVDSSWQISEITNWGNTVRRSGMLSWLADRWSTVPQSVTANIPVADLVVAYAQQTSIAKAATWTEKLTGQGMLSPLPSKFLAVTALADYAYRQQQPAQVQALLSKLESEIEPYIERLRKDGQMVEPIRSEAYGRLAVAYGKAGQMSQARRLLQLAMAANPDLGNPQVAQPSDNPYSLMMEAKLFGLAYEAAQLIKTDYRLTWMYEPAIALVQANQFEPAKKLLTDSNLKGGMRVRLLLAIAGQPQTDHKTAQTMLQDALKEARSIPGAESEFDRLGAEGGTVIPMETDRGSVVISVAVAYAKRGQLEQARAIVASLKDEENRRDGMRLIQEAQKPSC